MAPTVEYPVGPSRFFDGLFLTCWSTAACTIAFWTLLAEAPGARHLFGAGVALAAFAAAASARRRPAIGTLAWDGRRWWWESRGLRAPGEMVPCLDLQRMLLLRFDAEAGRFWLWAERAAAPQRWAGLRQAVAQTAPGVSADSIARASGKAPQ